MDLYCHAIEHVAQTWRIVQEIPNYQEVVGVLLFRQLFLLAPSAVSLYSFGSLEPTDTVDEAVFESKAFVAHARLVVSMLEKVIRQMQGNNMETLARSLQSLGSRHLSYGVHPAHYRAVETALLRALAEALGDKWQLDMRSGWAAVFKFVGQAMMSGAGAELEIIKERRRKLESSKTGTLRLKVIGNGPATARHSSFGRDCCTGCRPGGSDPGENPHHQVIKAASDPPKKPTRCDSGRSLEVCKEDDDESSVGSLMGNSSRRVVSPPTSIIVAQVVDDSDSNSDNSLKHTDMAPKMPRRMSGDAASVTEKTSCDEPEEDYGVWQGNVRYVYAIGSSPSLSSSMCA